MGYSFGSGVKLDVENRVELEWIMKWAAQF